MPLPAPRQPLPHVDPARGQGPRAPARPTRQSVACFGAVALRTGKFAHSFSPVFNAVEFEKFLRLLLRRRSPGRRIVVVLDNARYHHAKPLEPFSANAPAFSNCCSSRPTAPTSRQSNESGNWPGDSPRTTSTSRTCKHWSTRSPRVLTHGNIPTPRFGVYAALFKSLCLAAIGGVGLPPAVQQEFVSLIDLEDGRVIWFNVLPLRGSLANSVDARTAEGATAMVEALLDGLPL